MSNVKKYKVCEYCNKILSPLAETCPKCGHPHLTEYDVPEVDTSKFLENICPRCLGLGNDPKFISACHSCGGTGRKRV